MTYGQLRDATFARATAKMANCSNFKSPKTAYNIAKINRRIIDEAKLADEIYQKIVHQYAKKDEAGELEPHEGRPGTFVIADANVVEWTAKLKEFHAISFDIDRPKILLEEVQAAAALSPTEIMLLEDLLEYDDGQATPGLRAVE